MPLDAALVHQLTGEILDEVFLAMGLRSNAWPRRALWPLVWLPAHRFARIAAGFDGIVARSSFQEAARWLLPRFTAGAEARGVEYIPRSGPLLVASNHPGAFDSLVLGANIPRPDLKVIVSGSPFLRNLPNAKANFIFIADDPHTRMNALRSALRHLQNGGCLLLFATGLVDPDPSFLPGAGEALDRWSGSLDIFLRKAPETCVVVSIVSGVLAPRFMRHPLVRRGQMQAWQRQRIAEYIQLIQQLVFGWNYGLIPRVTFSRPLLTSELPGSGESREARQDIVAYAKETLANHLSVFSKTPVRDKKVGHG